MSVDVLGPCVRMGGGQALAPSHLQEPTQPLLLPPPPTPTSLPGLHQMEAVYLFRTCPALASAERVVLVVSKRSRESDSPTLREIRGLLREPRADPWTRVELLEVFVESQDTDVQPGEEGWTGCHHRHGCRRGCRAVVVPLRLLPGPPPSVQLASPASLARTPPATPGSKSMLLEYKDQQGLRVVITSANLTKHDLTQRSQSEPACRGRRLLEASLPAVPRAASLPPPQPLSATSAPQRRSRTPVGTASTRSHLLPGLSAQG